MVEGTDLKGRPFARPMPLVGLRAVSLWASGERVCASHGSAWESPQRLGPQLSDTAADNIQSLIGMASTTRDQMG
jgi:hypothetical protein